MYKRVSFKPEFVTQKSDCKFSREFVPSFNCTNTEYHYLIVRECNRSFPSGHAAISVFTSLFMIWYLQRRSQKIGRRWMVLLVQLLFVAWAVFCSISRITDKRHYWWDVLAGTLIGIVMTFYTCKGLCKSFNYLCKQETDVSLSASKYYKATKDKM